jgi:hypothetical protein
MLGNKPPGTSTTPAHRAPYRQVTRWYLEVDSLGAGVASFVEAVEIRSNAETHVAVTLEPGTDRTIALVFPEGASWNSLRVTVRDGLGRLFRADSLAAKAGVASVLVRLPVGSFALEASTDTGLAAHGTLDVSDLGPQRAAVVLAFR